jgi:hypothetical protein
LTKLLLYAQPAESEPYLSKAALKKGKYQDGGGVLGGLSFTDVGKAVWESADKIYSEFEVDPIEMGVGPAPWALRFTTSQFRLVVTRRAYKSFEGAQGSYITLDFDGDKHAIFRFLKTFLKSLRRAPWEIAFPPEFRERTGVKVKEIAADWEKFAAGVSLGEEVEEGEEEAEKKRAPPPPAPVKKVVKVPAKLVLKAGAFLGFEGDSLVMNVKVENASAISLEKVEVTPRASAEAIQFGVPAKMISYLKPGESLTLAFPVATAPGPAAGEVWAETEGLGNQRKVQARTQPRKLQTELPGLAPVEIASMQWHQKASVLVRQDEVRSKVFMAASEAFDEMLMRLKTTGFHMLDPEVIHTGTNYLGHLKMYAEDADKRPFAFALDCVGDYQESKITLHFYAESAELVTALREKVLAALAGKG